jgi:hypothetical protein
MYIGCVSYVSKQQQFLQKEEEEEEENVSRRNSPEDGDKRKGY